MITHLFGAAFGYSLSIVSALGLFFFASILGWATGKRLWYAAAIVTCPIVLAVVAMYASLKMFVYFWVQL